ncbi:MAG: two-component system response regulator [Desulfobacteraceae bacterium]
MPPKIVIIDDEVHVRTLLEQTLEELEEKQGVEIFSAPGGGKGLDLIKKERPSLVFLDVIMPDIDGFELCRLIKGDPQTAGIPVVLLTAKGQVADRQEGLACGAADYLTKPFDPDQVLTLAKAFLGGRRRESPSGA